jgi:excisionase family DNA binding protein
MLSARDVSERLGFSIDTILRWTREGKLRAYRISGTKHGRLRYLEEDLEALLVERATAATPAREAPTTRSDAALGRVSLSSPTTPPRFAGATTEEEPSDATR